MSLVALAKPHPCVFKAPVLDSVDTRIFTLRYFTRCMECGFCNDQCCSYGVDIDAQNAERVLGLGEAFASTVPTAAADWFDPELFEDAEFPSGRYRRTKARDGHCVFHRKDGRGCLIHAWCLEQGLDYHLYKPMVSTLFPLTFDHGCLKPSNEAIDGSLVCTAQGPSLYRGAREELAYYFGAGLIAELDAMEGSLSSAA